MSIFKKLIIDNSWLICYSVALQHMLDVLRHVKPKDVYVEHEKPKGYLQLPLLKFNQNLPREPKSLELNRKFLLSNINFFSLILNLIFFSVHKLLSMLKSKIRTIMQYYSKNESKLDIDINVLRYQRAVVENYLLEIRPRVDSFDFD